MFDVIARAQPSVRRCGVVTVIEFRRVLHEIFPPKCEVVVSVCPLLRHEAVNVGGAWHVLGAVMPTLLAQAAQGRGGHLSLVASVAGYRALPNALAYGPTKAALIHMAESLHLELSPLGLGVSVINPGFVDTPLTAQNGFRMPALITPEEAASEMLKGWARGDFEVHFPRRFTLLLKALRMFPQALYESLVRRATGH